MDISTLKPLNEVEVHIKHPITSEATDIIFTVEGSNSKTYRQAIRDITVRRISSAQKQTAEELEDDELTLLALCTKSFSGIEENGVKVQQTLEEAKRIYREYKWIREQVEAYASNSSNFFLKTPKA